MRFFHLGGRTWWRDNANANDMAKAKLLGPQIQAPALQRDEGGRILQRQLIWRTIGVTVIFWICLQDVLTQTADGETPDLPAAHELDHYWVGGNACGTVVRFRRFVMHEDNGFRLHREDVCCFFNDQRLFPLNHAHTTTNNACREDVSPTGGCVDRSVGDSGRNAVDSPTEGPVQPRPREWSRLLWNRHPNPLWLQRSQPGRALTYTDG